MGEPNITAPLFAAATVPQVFAATSSSVDWSVATEQRTSDNLMRYVLLSLRVCVWSQEAW